MKKDTKETKAPLPKIGPYDLALLAATLRPNLSLRKDEFTSALSAAYSLYTGAWEYIEGLPIIDTDLPREPILDPNRPKPEHPDGGVGEGEPEPKAEPEPEKGKGAFFGKRRT